MRGNSRFSPNCRCLERALTKSIKIRFKMPKLPKYEGKWLLCCRGIDRSAIEQISRSSLGVTAVKALLILENQILVRHVHILFTRAFLPSPAAGLRLEIANNIDKEKSELYFYLSVKKFLTEKPIRACATSDENLHCFLSNHVRAHWCFLCFDALLMFSPRSKSSCCAS